MEQTLSIIKPDAVAKNVVGKILDRFETAGLRIAATRKMQLSQAEAEAFYAVHGSDSLENAANEINFFFAQKEIC